jgi:hypothetical protein
LKYSNIREESLKIKVGQDWFKEYDTTEILGNIDFTVFPKQDNLFGRSPFLWAEAKTGDFDLITMFVQLILTIGKARTFDKTPPPEYIGSFDFKKISFISYISIQDIFYLNDFNWNVTPSNHDTREFQIVKERIDSIIQNSCHTFDFIKDETELKYFIKNNLSKASSTSKLRIDKNNFIPIYLRWVEIIKPIIDVDWVELRKANILDSDFYLADLFVDDKDTQILDDDYSIKDNLFVVFHNQGYKISKENIKQMFDATIRIRRIDTYQQFWKRYKRPPLKEIWNYIIERRDLLVPQDIRERKGAYFTPRQWVELAQKYLTTHFGDNWQDEYIIWDCAAGTGNLLAGLTNKYNIFASTIDQADVKVIHERIDHGANLLKNHVFQFDFLNDSFEILPQELLKTIKKGNKKILLYINPPYAEVSSVGEKGKKGVNISKTHAIYSEKIGAAGRELFALFLIRIKNEIPNCMIAEFSTLKIFNGSAFDEFRKLFNSFYVDGFMAPAYTFDNVKGKFPIGFKIWDTSKQMNSSEVKIDIYNDKTEYIGEKVFFTSQDKKEYINSWINKYKIKSDFIGFLAGTNGNDFQQNAIVYLLNKKEQMANPRGIWVNSENILPVSVYFAVRKSIEHTWIIHNDQFLSPLNHWSGDREFQLDCLTILLFHEKNNIQSSQGVNNWIPFSESEVEAKGRFESNFMFDLISGNSTKFNQDKLFPDTNNIIEGAKFEFSQESLDVFNCGRELFKYYHQYNGINLNASLYDIREFFQGRNPLGRMNSKSDDANYNLLIENLRKSVKELSLKIQPKIFEYGFLK